MSSPYQLKHVANHEQRVVQGNLIKGWTQPISTGSITASCRVRYSPTPGRPGGLTEQQAREAGYDITVKVQTYGDVAYGWAMEDTTGLCKVIAERGTGRILGCHILGLKRRRSSSPSSRRCRSASTPAGWPAASTGSTWRCPKS